MGYILKYRSQIGLLIAPLVVLLILRLLGFDGLYGQDSYEYLRYTIKMKEFFLTGIHPGYFFWPKGYPIVAGLLAILISGNWATQIVTALSLGGTLIYSLLLVKSLNKNSSDAFFYVIITLFLAPYMLRGGVVSMSDMLATFCLVGSVFYGFRYERGQTFKVLLLCVFLGMASVFTRYVAAIPVGLIFIGVGYFWIRNILWKHLVVVAIPIIFIAIHFYLDTKGIDFVNHEWLNTWSFSNVMKAGFTNNGGTLNYPLPNIVYSLSPFFHLGFFGVNVILLLLSIKMNLFDKKHLLIVVLILFYALFLAGIPYQNKRFLLLSYPLVVVLLYPAFGYLLSQYGSFRKYILSGLLIVQLVLFVKAVNPMFQLNKTEKSIAAAMQDYQHQTLYSFEIDVSLEGRGLVFDYKNMWKEEYSSFENNALVLFNEEKIKDQWKIKKPMFNWNNLKQNYKLVLLEKLSEGWNLYRIEK